MITQEQASQIASVYLQKEDTQRVFVNQNGLHWINNEPERMESYFEGKKEKYWMFENVIEETNEDVNVPVKRGRKK